MASVFSHFLQGFLIFPAGNFWQNNSKFGPRKNYTFYNGEICKTERYNTYDGVLTGLSFFGSLTGGIMRKLNIVKRIVVGSLAALGAMGVIGAVLASRDGVNLYEVAKDAFEK